MRMSMKLMNETGTRQRSVSGFTLIEIVVILAIIAVMAGAMAPFAIRQMEQAKIGATEKELESIEAGLLAYYRDCQALPTQGSGLGALVQNLDSNPSWDGPYVGGSGAIGTEIASDAWGSVYTYALAPRIRGMSDPVDFIVISDGSDRARNSRLRGGRWRLDTDADIVLVGSTAGVDESWQAQPEEHLDDIVDAITRYYLDVGSFPPGNDDAALAELVTSTASGWAGPYLKGTATTVTRDEWGSVIRLRQCTRVDGQSITGRLLLSDGPGAPNATRRGTRWQTGSNDIHREIAEASLTALLNEERIREARQRMKILAGEVYASSPNQSPNSYQLTTSDPWGRRYRYHKQSTYSGFVYSLGPNGTDDTGQNDDPVEGLVWDGGAQGGGGQGGGQGGGRGNGRGGGVGGGRGSGRGGGSGGGRR